MSFSIKLVYRIISFLFHNKIYFSFYRNNSYEEIYESRLNWKDIGAIRYISITK
jgi:hypothetical protein